MANAINSIGIDRANLFKAALNKANEKLEGFELVVRFVSQFPKKEEVADPDEFDERPDIVLEMRSNGNWLPIDIVYIRQMPQEPEKLKTLEELKKDIFDKAVRYMAALIEPHMIITSSGAIIETKHLQKHTFEVDPQGYVRVDALRVVCKAGNGYLPLKASQLHTHTAMIPEELEGGVFNITDSFDKIRKDGKQGMYCLTKKADSIALERIIPARQDEAKEYGKRQYIPLVRTWEEVDQLSAGTSKFFN